MIRSRCRLILAILVVASPASVGARADLIADETDRIKTASNAGSAATLEAALRQSIAQVQASYTGNPAGALEAAGQIQLKLGDTNLLARTWRDRSIPVLLQTSFNDRELIVAAVTPAAVLPNNWNAAANFVRPWATGRNLPDQAIGFAHPLEPGMVAGSLHPLSVYMLRPYLQKQSLQPGGEVRVRSFLEAMAIQAAASPELAIVAGDLIITTAEGWQVAVEADGSVSAPGAAQGWKVLVEQVLDTVVVNSEGGDVPSPGWRGRSNRVRDLIDMSPPWNKSKRGSGLRKRAQMRVAEASKRLGTALTAGADALPGGVNILEDSTRPFRVAARLATPIVETNSPARDQCISQFQAFSKAVEAAESGSNQVRQTATLSAEVRSEYKRRITSPVLLSEVVTATPTGAIAHVVSLEGIRRINAGMTTRQLRAAIDDPAAWPDAVGRRPGANGGTASTLSDWANLELWDGLRGRGTNATGDDASLLDDLFTALPDWLRNKAALPVNATDSDAAGDTWATLRPVLSALAHLNLPDGANRTALLSRVEDNLGQLTPSASLFSLLAAARIEMAVVRATAPGLSPADPLGDLTPQRFDQWRQWSVAAMASPRAWESRAGMDGLILLGQVAQLSGNPVATATAMQAVDSSPPAQALMARCVDATLLGQLSLAESDLPLALAACEFGRLQREVAESIATQAADAFARRPGWLDRLKSSPSLATEVIDPLARALAYDPAGHGLADAFLKQARLPSRTLLLTVLEAKIGDLRRSLRLRIEPLREADPDLVLLGKLRSTLRLLAGADGVLLDDEGRLGSLRSAVPWWTVAFWARPADASTLPTASTAEGRRIVLATWATGADRSADRQVRSQAAMLEASIPAPDLDRPADQDGRTPGDFPRGTWSYTIGRFATAIQTLEQVEKSYAEAVGQAKQTGQMAELVRLMKQSLEVDVVAHSAEIKAAFAQVCAANAELQASRQDSLASDLESIAAGLIYEAAKAETARRAVLVEVSKVEVKIQEKDEAAKLIDDKIARKDGDIHALKVDLARNRVERANLMVEMAQKAREGVLERIKLLRSLLDDSIAHTRPDGSTIQVQGRIGVMGAQIEEALTKRLAQDLAEAQNDVKVNEEKEAKQKKLERQRKLISAVTRFAGAVVGVVIGGSAGAALGAEIGGAVGELANGVLENRPPENILVGLVDNAFAIAEKSGVDLQGELNALGAKGAEEARQFFVGLDSTLGPLLETMPSILKDSTIDDAMAVLGLDGEIPAFMQLLASSYGDLKVDLSNVKNLGTALQAAGIDHPVNATPRDLLEHLKDSFFNKSTGNAQQVEAMARRMGVAVEKIGTVEGQREAAERLAKVVMGRVSLESASFRGDALRRWTIAKQEAKVAWDAARPEGEALVNALFPNPKDQAEVIANLKMTLIDKATLQGMVEQAIAPWQKALDERIAAISEACNKPIRTNPPSSALDAARARLAAIIEFQDGLLGKEQSPGVRQGGLVEWLRGDSSERVKLFLELKNLEDQDLQEVLKVKLQTIDLAGAQNNEKVADIELQKAKDQIDKIAFLVEKSRFESDKASLMVRVSELAHMTAGKEEEAKNNSALAGKARSAAAADRVRAAEFKLEAARAREEGVRQRGGVARRIESAIALPPIELDRDTIGIPQGIIAEARWRHANALEEALAAYRELLRHLRIAGVKPADYPTIGSSLAAREGLGLRWSVTLNDTSAEIKKLLFDKNSLQPHVHEPIRFPLNESQVHRLLTTGLQVVARPDVTTSLEGEEIVIRLDDAEARSARVLSWTLMGSKTGGDEVQEKIDVESKAATYLGDRRLAGDQVFLSPQQAYPLERFMLLPPAPSLTVLNTTIALQQIAVSAGSPGDQLFEQLEGAPLAGTTSFRLKPVPKTSKPLVNEVKHMDLILLYIYYNR